MDGAAPAVFREAVVKSAENYAATPFPPSSPPLPPLFFEREYTDSAFFRERKKEEDRDGYFPCEDHPFKSGTFIVPARRQDLQLGHAPADSTNKFLEERNGAPSLSLFLSSTLSLR